MVETNGCYAKCVANALKNLSVEPVLTGFVYQPANSYAGRCNGKITELII